MPLKEKYYKTIKEIAKGLPQPSKSDFPKPKDYLLHSPLFALAEIVVKYENKELEESEVRFFLQKRLQISAEKATEIKTKLQERILNQLKTEKAIFVEAEENLERKLKEDKYREPIK